MALLISVVIIFYRWADKAIYLILLVIGILIININSDNEYLHIISSTTLIAATAGFSFIFNKTFQFFIITTSLTLTVIFSANYYFLKSYENVDILSKSKDTFIEMIKESPNISDNDKKELFTKLDDSLETLQDIIPFTYFLNSIFRNSVPTIPE